MSEAPSAKKLEYEFDLQTLVQKWQDEKWEQRRGCALVQWEGKSGMLMSVSMSAYKWVFALGSASVPWLVVRLGSL